MSPPPSTSVRQTGHFSRANWNRCPPPTAIFHEKSVAKPPTTAAINGFGSPLRPLASIARCPSGDKGAGSRPGGASSVGPSNCLCNSPHIAATAATAFLSPEVTSAESFNPKWPSYRPKGQSRRRPRPGLDGPPSVPSVRATGGGSNESSPPLRRSSRMGDPLTIRASDLALLTH